MRKSLARLVISNRGAWHLRLCQRYRAQNRRCAGVSRLRAGFHDALPAEHTPTTAPRRLLEAGRHIVRCRVDEHRQFSMFATVCTTLLRMILHFPGLRI